ncbi:cupin domain-containing protein [Vibrio nomapromontoriensis]|uniref:cupin domain-containing protein n=1 Tax=Vibrio nomapromontoriensis TaxID=2910246 RepID=UPI003D0F435F
MKKTSFGFKDVLFSLNEKPKIEILTFENDGNEHQHKEHESFVVMEGEGTIYSGDNVVSVGPGDVVTIPPQTKHWMEPKNGKELKGFLWYHTEELNVVNG